jgi:hypothetical protein
VEIDEKALARALHEQLIPSTDVRCKDFLAVQPFPVHAVVGNPPYVRLRHVENGQRQRALLAANTVLNRGMDPAGSLWMPFVLHAMRFLSVGGRLAFVLPYEFTYVRYARPLWAALRDNFGSLEVLRTHERLFPDLLQDVVILLADGYGAHTQSVRFRAFERVDDLLRARPVVDEALTIEDLLRGERVFVEALLGDELRRFLRTRVADAAVPARRLVTFNIGYVAGDKAFFHPSEHNVQEFALPQSSLRPSLTSARALKGAGLRTSSWSAAGRSSLFVPNEEDLTDGERRYIAMGEKQGVSRRYKCRIRKPWYKVPGLRIPDVVLSVFSERPLLMLNDARCLASNSLLCGYSIGSTSEEIAAGWYTSLTLLQCELEVHALGGGVMVMVPNETGNVRLPKAVRAEAGHIDHLDRVLRLGKVTDAYQAGDRRILIDQLKFGSKDVDLIRQGLRVLAHWRTSARATGTQPTLDPVPSDPAIWEGINRKRPKTVA